MPGSSDSTQDGVHIALLGGLTVRVGEQTIRHFETRKTAALIAFLAITLGRTHSRDYLAELLWPEEDAEATRVRLRQTLSSVRRVLGSEAGALQADRVAVGFDPERVSTDVREFEELRRRAARAPAPEDGERLLSAALEVAAGPVVPDLYELWADRERERVSDLVRQTLLDLAETCSARGEHPAAIDFARRAVDLDPLREDAQAALMRTYALAGQNAAAIRQFQTLEAALRAELDAAPGPGICTLLETIRSGAITPVPSEVPPLKTEPASVPPGAASTSPPSPPASRGRPIPVPLTRFFGRAGEVDFLLQELSPSSVDRRRLVTLTGVGGTGKTRLALEAAGRLAGSFPGGVVFVPLADIDDARLIPEAILSALGAEAKGRDAMDAAAAALEGQSRLLLLDNFEQVVEEGASVVGSLLERAPSLTCLVTSRQSLALSGERELPLAPLPPPARSTPAEILESPAVQMFVDRATAVRPAFRLTPENAEAVADVCRLLDGLPLAIDLVAAWSAALTPAQMCSRLASEGMGLDLLVSRNRDASARHRSLRAALDGSWEQAPPELQGFFARLSVFRGGFTLGLAAEVAGEGDEMGALEALTELTNRSLIRSEEPDAGGEIRFRLLETVRAYAAEKLGAEGEVVREAHARTFWRMAARSAAQARSAEEAVYFDALETESGNLRAAMEWGRRNDPAGAVAAAVALGRFWRMRSHAWEWGPWLRDVLRERGESIPADARADGLHALGIQLRACSRFPEARAAFTESVALCRAMRDEVRLITSLRSLGSVARDMRDYDDARRILEELAALVERQDDELAACDAVFELSLVLSSLDDQDGSMALTRQCIDRYRRLDQPVSVTMAVLALGGSYYALGEYEAARPLLEQSLREAEALGVHPVVGAALHGLGDVARQCGETEAALDLYRRSAEVFTASANVYGQLFILESCAGLALGAGDAERAARLLGLSDIYHEKIDSPLAPLEEREFNAMRDAARDALGDAAFRAGWDAGRGMTLEQGLALALEN